MEDDCWYYAGLIDWNDYGRIWGPTGYEPAHRVMYEALVGPIPEGMVLDHLCKVKLCINPDHLEPVPQKLNVLRGTSVPAINAVKTHCKNGHEYTKSNTLWKKQKNRAAFRACLTCLA